MAGHPAGSPPTCSPPRWAPGLPRGSFHCHRSPVHPDTTAHAAAPKPWGGRTRGPPLNGFGVGTLRHLAQPRVGAGVGCRHLSHLRAPSEQGPSPSANPQGWPPERFTHINKTLVNPKPRGCKLCQGLTATALEIIAAKSPGCVPPNPSRSWKGRRVAPTPAPCSQPRAPPEPRPGRERRLRE